MNRAELISLIDSGYQPVFLLFYGHTAKSSSKIDAACLSQWWPCHFAIGGIEYSSAEHFMMASKARLFGDESALAQVLACESPREAKAIGRTVTNFDDETWKRARFDFVVAGNIAKFGQNAAMRDYLLSTGDQILVEAAPRDVAWGIGLGSATP